MPSRLFILTRTTPFSVKFVLGRSCGEQGLVENTRGKLESEKGGKGLSLQVQSVFSLLFASSPDPTIRSSLISASAKQTQEIIHHELTKADCRWEWQRDL